jgi:hypothetical protein
MVTKVNQIIQLYFYIIFIDLKQYYANKNSIGNFYASG